jgi:hypothetical protein
LLLCRPGDVRVVVGLDKVHVAAIVCNGRKAAAKGG